MHLLRPLDRHIKGDSVVEDFLTYGLCDPRRLLVHEDELSSRENCRRIRWSLWIRLRVVG